jgi:hypothetical protein
MAKLNVNGKVRDYQADRRRGIARRVPPANHVPDVMATRTRR